MVTSVVFKLASKTFNLLVSNEASAKTAFNEASLTLTGAAVVFTILPIVHRDSDVPILEDPPGRLFSGNHEPPVPYP